MGAVLWWWLLLLMIGTGFMPLSSFIFKGFTDRGWLFSKVIGFFLSGWIIWAASVCGILPFTGYACILGTLGVIIIQYSIASFRNDRSIIKGRDKSGFLLLKDFMKMAAIEELMFLGFLLLAFYVIGFKPEAYGTEKFMDYAFLTSMNRSTVLPPPDPWLAGESLNYYYGGQYYAAFLMKMSGVSPGYAYNLMRAVITALSFVLPFSLVFQMVKDKCEEPPAEGFSPGSRRNFFPWAGGLLAGLASAFAGNGHYLIYGLFMPFLAKIRNAEYSYWFPSSTRYIGYDPDVPDKTIHEFPSYSSILGDLHAHYVNLIFVIAVLAVIYAWARKRRDLKDRYTGGIFTKGFLKELLAPELLLAGMFTGVFRWTNAADFAVFYVVCGSVLFFMNLRILKRNLKKFILVTAVQAAVIFAVGTIAALPFTWTFENFTYGIALTHSHSPLYQLSVLWGLPALVLLGYVTTLIADRKHLPVPDLAALLFGLCAAGLVLLPELVYVKDIYGDEHYRANTMFKLTYAAFILFAVMMAYVLVRGLMEHGARRVLAAVGTVILIMTAGYTVNAVKAWFPGFPDPSLRKGSDAAVFVEESFPEDLGAISWLNENVSGSRVILEATGDSYSDYGRVSVATGLPTVAGWYVHEWLWRGGFELIGERTTDADRIYASADADEVLELVRKYGIDYIYIGKLEYEKYPYLDETFLEGLGEKVYEDENTSIIRMDAG